MSEDVFVADQRSIRCFWTGCSANQAFWAMRSACQFFLGWNFSRLGFFGGGKLKSPSHFSRFVTLIVLSRKSPSSKIVMWYKVWQKFFRNMVAESSSHFSRLTISRISLEESHFSKIAIFPRLVRLIWKKIKYSLHVCTRDPHL